MRAFASAVGPTKVILLPVTNAAAAVGGASFMVLTIALLKTIPAGCEKACAASKVAPTIIGAVALPVSSPLRR
jgi:hypothetical protein